MNATTPPITWAVFLGCTTAARLAWEWNIPKHRAASLLNQANLAGHIVRLRRGVYGPPVAKNDTCATQWIDVSINALLLGES